MLEDGSERAELAEAAMRITQDVLRELQAALAGGVAARAAPPGDQRYHVGAIWHGNWHDYADRGSFGSPEKPNHYACIARRNDHLTRFTLHPITSIRHDGPDVLVLPRGRIPSNQFVCSYLLTRIKLVATRETLDTRFRYTCSLTPPEVQSMKEMTSR